MRQYYGVGVGGGGNRYMKLNLFEIDKTIYFKKTLNVIFSSFYFFHLVSIRKKAYYFFDY